MLSIRTGRSRQYGWVMVQVVFREVLTLVPQASEITVAATLDTMRALWSCLSKVMMGIERCRVFVNQDTMTRAIVLVVAGAAMKRATAGAQEELRATVHACDGKGQERSRSDGSGGRQDTNEQRRISVLSASKHDTAPGSVIDGRSKRAVPGCLSRSSLAGARCAYLLQIGGGVGPL